jgi:hypothetical protein
MNLHFLGAIIMTDLKFSILEKLYHSEHRAMNTIVLQNELIQSFPAPDVYGAFKDLQADELIEYSLTDATELLKHGRVIYESVKEERQYQLECHQRELQAEQRASDSNALTSRSIRVTKIANIVAIGSIIITILSSAITLVLFFHQ